MKTKYFTIKLQRPLQGHAPSWSHGCFFWLTFLLIGLWPATTEAQLLADTLDIRFERDSTRINMDFDGNGERWSRFERSFLEKFKDLPANSLRLDIYSGASPEGAAIYNQWLGENRGNAVQQLVRRRLGSAIGHIMVHNEGPRWDGLYKAVANSNEPWRDEVLSIIEMNSSYNNKERDARELRLRELHNGSVWEVLSERYLPPLRSGASAILTWEVPPPAEAATPVVSRRDTIYIIQQSAPCPPNANQISDMKRQRKDSIYKTRLDYPAWAVKTNLLLWGVVAPNVQLEIPLGRQNRWSLELEYFTPWFIWSHNSHASQCQNWGAELRYWLGNRKQHRWLQGWHVGIAVAGGYYDFEWKKHEGYQGEHLNTYVNIGYQHRWGNHWGLDFGVGAGALFTKYRHYYGGSVYPDNHLEEWDEHLIYHDKGNFTWAGPCHANITLAYFFNAWPLRTKTQKLDNR